MYDRTLVPNFYDPYQKRHKHHNEIKKFLDEYSYGKLYNMPKLESVSKRNLNILRLINDYLVKYQYIMIICMTIHEYSREYYNNPSLNDLKDELTIIYSRLMRIMISLKKQHGIALRIRDTVKKVSYDENIYDHLKLCINDMIKRIGYLVDTVIPCYIEITPLYDYKIYLEENGKDIIDDMFDYIQYDEFNQITRIEYETIHPLINNYINHINEVITTIPNCRYKDNFDEYYIKYKENRKIIEEDKRLKKEKELHTRIENAKNRLNDQCNNVRKDIDFFTDGALFTRKGKNSISVIKLKDAAADFKKCNQCNEVKIIAFLTTKSTRSTLSFYNSLCNNYETKGLGKAEIFKIDDPLPEYLKKREDDGDIVIAEIIL